MNILDSLKNFVKSLSSFFNPFKRYKGPQRRIWALSRGQGREDKIEEKEMKEKNKTHKNTKILAESN